MRITSIDELSMNTSIESNKKNLKIGDIIKGKVIDNDKGKITIKTVEGQFITALLLSGENLSEGSIISFIVNQINQDQIYAEILKSKRAENTFEKQIPWILDEIGIKQNDLNEEVAKTLLKFWQPVNKDKVDYINYLLKTIETFKQNNPEALISMLFSDIDVLNSPIDMLNRASLDIDIYNIMSLDSLINNQSSLNGSLDKDIHSFMKNLSKTFSLNQNTLENFECLFYQLHKVLTSIDKADLETIIYLLSKDIEITPQNLFIIDKLIFEEKGLTDFLLNLINTLSIYDDKELKHYAKELSKIFIEAESIKNSSLKDQISNIVTILKQLDSAFEKKGIKDFKLIDNLHNLKSSIEFIKSINEHINYFHIPVVINDENSSVDIYIYKDGKRNKRVDSSNVSILISLSLKNIGYIEGLINIMSQNIKALFKTENKIVSQMINRYSEELKQSLRSKGYNIDVFAEEKSDKKFNLIAIEDRLNIGESTRCSIDVRL